MPVAEPRRALALALALATTCLLAACGGPTPESEAARQQAESPQEASLRSGDFVVRANTVATMRLGEAVARQYGVGRDADTVMLLVGVRRELASGEVAVPARVSATAVDLLGRRQALDMREIRSGDFIDYAGSARVSAPDTLRFDIRVVGDGIGTATLQISRDFYPH